MKGLLPCERRAPVFYVRADAPRRAHDILDDARAGERTPRLGRQPGLCGRKHLVEPFQLRRGNAVKATRAFRPALAMRASVLAARQDRDRSLRNRDLCDRSVHGVAFRAWNPRPEPPRSRRATPPLYCNNDRDIALILPKYISIHIRPILYYEYYCIQYLTGFTPIAPPQCD
jgi:hypothetical protein